MTKYLYNGVELPELPEWDKSTYPLAIIQSIDNIDYYLYVTSKINAANDFTSVTNGWYSFIAYKPMLFAKYTVGNSDWGALTEWSGTAINGNEATGIELGGFKSYFIWTNTSLYYGDVLAYEATFPVTPISGVWKFNETVSLIDNLGRLFLDAVFTSNGTEYWSIDTLHNPLNGSITLRYGINDGSGNFTIACVMKVGTTSLTLGWVDEAYRYIDFGATPQTVTEEFYEWLTENAVPFGGEPDEPETVLSWQKHDAYKPNTKWDGNTFYRVMGGKWVEQDGVVPVAEAVLEPDNCLTFSSAEPFTIGVNNATKNWDGSLYYSTDAETWSEWDGATAISSAEHNGEQRIYMRGIGNSVITGELFENEWVLTGSSVRCEGNIENLLDYETVANGEHPTMGDLCFTKLFFNWTALITAPELPATTLEYFCYSDMFSGCTSLVTAPELPATTLADYCYNDMFSGCTSLVTAPKLPATTLADYCYSYMFSGCTSLVTAPELPATTLADHCYASMFTRCSALTKAPELPATTLADHCYNRMFQSCTSLVTAPELPATLADNCYDFMFENCTALATLPKLYATSLPSACYRQMFSGCTNIKLSATQTGAYQTPYRIPMTGTGATTGNVELYGMFSNTGGTFTGTPEINTTYYTSNTVVPNAKEPIAYRYNGVQLPDINEVWTDKVTYPCAMITRTITDGTCLLHVCGDMPYYTEQAHSTEGYEPTVIAPKPYKAFAHVDGSWVLNTEETDYSFSIRTGSFELIWTNVDVMNKDNGSVYFDASEPPVPVYA